MEPVENDNLIHKLFKIQLADKKGNGGNLQQSVSVGRILECELDDTAADGASEEESQGFMDAYDLPPIDTWFYLADNSKGLVLYAWIPDQFVSLVNKSVEANPMDMLHWYTIDQVV